MEIIQINELKKSYKNNPVLNGINLSINKAEIIALLGPNGAGKTTLIRCLLKILKINSGKVLYNGKPLSGKIIQNNFSYLPEDFFPQKELTCVEFLSIFAEKEKYLPCLEKVGLAAKKNKKIRHLSHGMVKKLGLAMLLAEDNKIVILDEPFAGLDILGQKNALDIIAELKNTDKTIIICSHILHHIEKVASRIALINKGKIAVCDTTENLYKNYGLNSLEAIFLKELNNG